MGSGTGADLGLEPKSDSRVWTLNCGMTAYNLGFGTQGVSLKYHLSPEKRMAGACRRVSGPEPGGGNFPEAGNGTLTLPHHSETPVLATSPSNSPLRLALSVLSCPEGRGALSGKRGAGPRREAEAAFLAGTTQTPRLCRAFQTFKPPN